MNPADESRLDPAVVAELYRKHQAQLRSFLIGVLRDWHLANDALQATFAKVVEVGHTAMKESLKGWLFRVALNEALAIRRRQQTRDRALERVAWTLPESSESPDESVVRSETVSVVRAALDSLGTVLSRMQLAIKKLRKRLQESDQS